MIDNELTEKVIGCGINVHKSLGPGLLESAYKECLYYELLQNNILVVREKPMPLVYREVKLDCGYRIDLLVSNQLVVEIKSVDAICEIHIAQALTYMKLGNYEGGLILNFNEVFLKDGIKRLINSKDHKNKINSVENPK